MTLGHDCYHFISFFSSSDFINRENTFFLKKAISTENAKGSTHSIRVVKLFSKFNFLLGLLKKENEGRSIYYKIT